MAGPLVRTVESLRERGEAVPLPVVARELLASVVEVPEPIARRVVAAALGRSSEELPERLGPADLEVRPPPPAWAADPLERAEFHVVDLETTGLSRDARILEIGAVHLAGGRRVSHFFSLVRPPGRIPAKITALTGIDEAMVRDAPPAGEVLPRFRAWLDRAPHAAFVAHNAPFDAGFVGRGLAREGLRPLSAPIVCTRKLARRALPELHRYDLDRLCVHFGIDNRARHRATGDAAATATLLLELLAIVGRQGVETLGDLVERLDAPPPRRRRRRR